MDLQNIQDQLNTEFAKSETRIIFWFDDKGEYEDEVSELQFLILSNIISLRLLFFTICLPYLPILVKFIHCVIHTIGIITCIFIYQSFAIIN